MRRNRDLAAGFTLIELMVTVAIIALIAAIAYPSYTQYIMRSKRAVATSFLSQVADRQEQFFLDNKRYGTLSEIGYAANSIGISDEGAQLAAGDGNRIYVISVDQLTATTYRANATPALVQASRDTGCAVLRLNQLGQKSHSGPGPNCW